jgi:hypothetical protein
MGQPSTLSVERFEVQERVAAFATLANMLPPPPAPHRELGENLQRAARAMRSSIEQAAGRRDGTFSYGVARGAAVQATTHIECYRCLRVIEPRQYEAAMALLRPLVTTLTRLAR